MTKVSYKKVWKICEQCGVSYWGAEKTNYHSRKCYYDSRIRPIGTKKLSNINGKLRWVIKTKKGWKSLSTFLLENEMGIKLTKSEKYGRLRYIDGDCSNCTIANLVVLDQDYFNICCQKCHKVYYTSDRRYKSRTKLCKACWKISPKKLSENQVTCIKSVLGISPSTLARWFCVTTGCIWYILNGNGIYKEIEPMAKQEVWKTFLSQHDKSVAKTTTILYDRVTLLAKVFEDEHYRTAMKEQGKNELELLDLKLSDTFTNFSVLYQILKMFPNRKTWLSTNLLDMKNSFYDKLKNDKDNRLKEKRAKQEQEAREVEGKDNKDLSDPAKKPEYRRSATIAQVRELTEENNRLKEQLQSANQIIKSLENQLEGTRETIGTLNEALSILKMNTKVKV